MDKELTPMQQAIEALQKEMQKATEQESPNIASGFHHSIIILQSFLPTEKVQIEQAYNAGEANDGDDGMGRCSEEYFTNKYKQDQ